MQLSKNFSLAEMTKSQTAIRMGMSNNPSEGEVENLRLLCERVLQPVRDHFNHTVTISSGYRNEILSQKIAAVRPASIAQEKRRTSKSLVHPTTKSVTGSKRTSCGTNLF